MEPPPPPHHQFGVVYVKTNGERERLKFGGQAWPKWPDQDLIYIGFGFDARCDLNAVAITDWNEIKEI